MISIHAKHVAGRAGFDFRLWKPNEVTDGADFRERNIANNVFELFQRYSKPYGELKLEAQVRFLFHLRTEFLKTPKCKLFLNLDAYEWKPKTISVNTDK